MLKSKKKVASKGPKLEQIKTLRQELKKWKTWVPPGHFYSPIPSPTDIAREVSILNVEDESHIPGIELQTQHQLKLLRSFRPLCKQLWIPEFPTPHHRFHFNNEFFSYADAISLYCMMKRQQPRRIVEVGSGFSSALMLDILDREPTTKLQLTFIEPYPDRIISLLQHADLKRVNLIQKPVQDIPIKTFTSLDDGDILFIDGSHISKAGSDVNFLIFEVLPRLKNGVFVHFHDVFFPFSYPKEWLNSGVAWNEAYLLRAFLQYNPCFKIEFFVSYLVEKHRSKVAKFLPAMLKSELRPLSQQSNSPGASLWLRKYPVR
ncbi:MAG: class I SAM-dependent methyltransferase [Bdellovibrionales bacterium]